MQIKRNLVPEMPVEQFAVTYGLTMVVNERRMDRWQRCNGLKCFTACFESAEVAEGGMLRGVYGEGETEAEAIADYCDQINGERLVLNAFRSERREIAVPRLLAPATSMDARILKAEGSQAIGSATETSSPSTVAAAVEGRPLEKEVYKNPNCTIDHPDSSCNIACGDYYGL